MFFLSLDLFDGIFCAGRTFQPVEKLYHSRVETWQQTTFSLPRALERPLLADRGEDLLGWLPLLGLVQLFLTLLNLSHLLTLPPPPPLQLVAQQAPVKRSLWLEVKAEAETEAEVEAEAEAKAEVEAEAES